MTPSKLLTFLFCLFFFQSFWGGSTCMGGLSPDAVFERHKQEITTRKSSSFDGFTFALGHASAIKPNPSSLERARHKAKVRAKGNIFSGVSIDTSSWPDSILDSKVGQRLIKALHSIMQGKASVVGLQTVFERCYEQRCMVIVAAPSSGVKDGTKLSWETSLAVMDKAFSRRAPWLPLYDYLEICTPAQINEVVDLLGEKVGEQFGIAAGSVLAGKPINGPALLWKQGKRLSPEKVSSLGQQDLWQLLALDPYDPVVLYFLGKSFDEQGRYRIASILYSRGTTWFIDPEFNKKCRRAARFRVNHLILAEVEPSLPDEHLRQTVITQFSQSHDLPPGIAKLVVHSNGTLPLSDATPGRNSLYEMDEKDIALAIESNPTAASFAKAAEFFLNRKEVFAALPFAYQAARMNDQFVDLKKKVEGQMLTD